MARDCVYVGMDDEQRVERAFAEWTESGWFTEAVERTERRAVRALVSGYLPDENGWEPGQQSFCDGCHQPIDVGEHFMHVKVELDTIIPPAASVVNVPPTIFDVTVHNPLCLVLWCRRNPVIVDVFT